MILLERLRSHHGRGMLGGNAEAVRHRIEGAETIGLHVHDVAGGPEPDGRRPGKCQGKHAEQGRDLFLRAVHASSASSRNGQ